MRSLVHLDVSGNALSGSLLGAPGTLPPSLWSVAARNNSFSGPLSAAALAALPAVRVLDLTGNAVSGAVPGAALAHPALPPPSSAIPIDVELELHVAHDAGEVSEHDLPEQLLAWSNTC